jgi:hypothetical protein
MIGDEAGTSGDKSLRTLIRELIYLVITYVRQETIDPIKLLGVYVALGVAGALLIGIGGIMATLTVIRLLQAEANVHLSGSLTWVPYVGGILVAGLGVGWAITRIARRPATKGTAAVTPARRDR